jgi:GPH family glycoside/pentoside/hexuronide:cation symporter
LRLTSNRIELHEKSPDSGGKREGSAMDTRAPAGKPRHSLTGGRLAIFAAAGLPVGAYVATLAVYLPNYYARHLGLSLAAVGIAFTVVRVLDILLDPALGILMDSTKTRMGKYRPWLVASLPVLVVATWAAYFAHTGASALYLTFWLLVLYAGYSMCVLSHSAWGTALVAEYHERSRVYGWIQFVGVLGAAGVLVGPVVVTFITRRPVEPIPVMGWFLVISVPITLAITTLFADEPPPLHRTHGEKFAPRDYLALMTRPDMARSLIATLLTTFGPALTAPLYLFFFEDARGYTPNQANLLLLVYIVSGLFAPVFWTRVAKRFSKHQTIKIASVAYAVAQTCLLLLPKAHVFEMSIAMFAVGFVASAFAFVLRAMVADICDEVRLETGKDRTALLYALVTSIAKVASTVSVGVAYTLLPLFGFKAAEGAANTAQAMFGLQALYLVPPVVCVLLGGLAMLGYRLDEKRHGEIRASLDALVLQTAVNPLEPASQLAPGE